MAVVYHWKHGWIPLDHTAALSKAKGNHAAASRMMSEVHDARGIQSRQDVAKAVLDTKNLPAHEQHNAMVQIKSAAALHGATDLLPGARGDHAPFVLPSGDGFFGVNAQRDAVARAAQEGRVTLVPAGARNNAAAEIHVDGKPVGQASVLGHLIVPAESGGTFKEVRMKPRPGWKKK